MLESRCELREKSEVTCKISPFRKGIVAWVWKAVVKTLREHLVRFLLKLQFPFTH